MNSCRENKLRKLKENTPTIFAPNCWGGITYHHLGLQFCSPLINMHINHDEYLRFLSDPHCYMDQELQLREMYIDDTLENPFPVAKLGDISLWMNHYDDFEEAAAIWERRKARIKWDNLFVMFFDDDPVRIEKFLKLPYEHKICFVPFVPWVPYPKELVPVNYRAYEELKRYPFWEIVNNLALGDFVLYDDVELLYGAKFVQIGNILREGQSISKYKGDTKRDTEK